MSTETIKLFDAQFKKIHTETLFDKPHDVFRFMGHPVILMSEITGEALVSLFIKYTQ